MSEYFVYLIKCLRQFSRFFNVLISVNIVYINGNELALNATKHSSGSRGRQPINLANVPQKLHENEKKLNRRGRLWRPA